MQSAGTIGVPDIWEAHKTDVQAGAEATQRNDLFFDRLLWRHDDVDWRQKLWQTTREGRGNGDQRAAACSSRKREGDRGLELLIVGQRTVGIGRWDGYEPPNSRFQSALLGNTVQQCP